MAQRLAFASRRVPAAALLGAVLVLSGAPARAVDYWVDQAHAQASDSNPGTETEPWLTIQHGADVAVGGDTVHVKPGTYVERVLLQTAGATGARITFRAEPRRQVTMHGFNTGWPWVQKYGHYVTIEGFNITNSPQFTNWDDVQGVFIQDTNNLEVLDNYLYEIQSEAITGSGDAVRIAGNTIYQVQMGIVAGGTSWIVEDNDVSRLYDYGGGDCDYARFFGEGHVFRGNFFHGTDFGEIGAAHVDCFQTFDNNGEHVRDILFEGNRCHDFHQALMGEASFYHNSGGLTFRNNVFAHGGAWGLCVKDIADVVAVNNSFVDIAYHGMGLSGQYATGGVARNNIFSGIETGYWAADGAEITGDYNLLDISQPPATPAAHDIVGQDPKFVDAANSDYHLQLDSPAVDTGEAQTGFDTDYDGSARPYGAGWDMGAFEYTPPCVAGTDCVTPPPCRTATGATCAAQQCVYPPEAVGTGCEDGDPCTTGDACDGAGACVPGPDRCGDGGVPDGGFQDDGGSGDGGGPPDDAGGAGDGAPPDGGHGSLSSGCGCTTSGHPAPAAVGLLLAVLVARGRRRLRASGRRGPRRG
ncbi:MAG: right-handed parallel beta-helix repeat-containing protein [Deltaproteobacteria bacterium]|nr:right-handed parallel beta-helix repeat-containing protein [Deltaproteobacteria bacterium]